VRPAWHLLTGHLLRARLRPAQLPTVQQEQPLPEPPERPGQAPALQRGLLEPGFQPREPEPWELPGPAQARDG
jgi:hypothetical protein